ncbi:MAG: hypothetical protein KQH83_10360 [Actinobacteria bacterium]|nr:hypothetical protein [Actinomycetota bacterium]
MSTPRRCLAITAAVGLLAAACGGSSGGTTAATTTTVPPTTAATTTLPPTTTTSTTTTTTTTVPPTTTTTTTTTLPPQVQGWEGPGPTEIAVDLSFDIAGPDADLLDLVEGALEAMGLAVIDGADTVLALDLRGDAKGASYGDAGYCYTGARVRGDMTLSAPDRPVLEVSIDGDEPTSFVVFSSVCADHRDPEDAPFPKAFEPEFMEGIVEWWGPASVPYLVEIMDDELYVIGIRTRAVQAVRSMEWEAIPEEMQYEFLAAAVDYCGRSTHITDDRDYDRFREAVARLFAEALDIDVSLDGTEMIGLARFRLETRYGK